MLRHKPLALLLMLLSLSLNVLADEDIHCPLHEATGEETCIYSRHIVFREDAPPKIKIKGKVISLKVVSKRVLRETKPHPGLPGYKTETKYEGPGITVAVTDLIKTNSCHWVDENGKLVESESCCGAGVQKSFVIRHQEEEIKFTVSKWDGA